MPPYCSLHSLLTQVFLVASYATGQQSSSGADLSIQGPASLSTALIYNNNDKTTGSLFTVDENKTVKLRWERSKGVFLNPDVNFTPEALAKRWTEINDFSEPSYPHAAMDFGKLLPQTQLLPGNPQLPSTSFSGRVVLVTGGASG